VHRDFARHLGLRLLHAPLLGVVALRDTDLGERPGVDVVLPADRRRLAKPRSAHIELQDPEHPPVVGHARVVEEQQQLARCVSRSLPPLRILVTLPRTQFVALAKSKRVLARELLFDRDLERRVHQRPDV
jgi:hypothetical protein